MAGLSIVEYFGSSGDGHRCGYCGSGNTNFTQGMWAHKMTCEDYQDLIDRGWRRSGKYVYKPMMRKTCCPLYTIKCDAICFHLSKSQKKVLKRMTKFLTVPKTESKSKDDGKVGDKPSGYHGPDMSASMDLEHPSTLRPATAANLEQINVDWLKKETASKNDVGETGARSDPTQVQGTSAAAGSPRKLHQEPKKKREKTPACGLGPDPSKPPCRKAKIIRQERRKQKLAIAKRDAVAAELTSRPSTNSDAKSLEDLMVDSLPNQPPVHNLQIKLVPSDPRNQEFSQTFTETAELFFKYQRAIHKDPPEKCTERRVNLVEVNSAEFRATFKQAHAVYAKYQMVIHKDSPDECDESQFKRFLVDSPLVHFSGPGAPPMGYGSFHQQYFVDGKLIAVGVLDILPRCVSSVYLFYDPDYAFLSLGVYSALREIHFTRLLQRRTLTIQNYYMGFYVHSCPKMKYKGQYSPSYLVCPETYNWIPIEKCVPKLDQRKYSRLDDSNDEASGGTEEDVLVLFDRQGMPYQIYRAITRADDIAEVREYADLVGPVVAPRMLLFRSGR